MKSNERFSLTLAASGLATFFFGLISVTLKPVVPKPWPDFCVGLGIALLIYSIVATGLWLTTKGPAKDSDADELKKNKNGGDPNAAADANRSKRSEPSKSPEEEKFDQSITLVKRIFLVLLCLGILGILLLASGIAAPLPFWEHFGRTAGTGLLLALGFLAGGMLLGFLFGLPRSTRKPDQKPPEKEKGAVENAQSILKPLPQDDMGNYDDNTNLEEVSDWLTKIIVGLGLIDLKDMPHQFKQASDFFAATCGSELCGGVFFTLGIFFFVVGFIASYILARVYVKITFSLMGKTFDKKEVTEVVNRQIRPVIDQIEPMMTRSRIQQALTINNAKGVTDHQLDIAIQTLDEVLSSETDTEIKYAGYIEKARALKRKALLPQETGRDKLLQQALEVLGQARKLRPDRGAAFYNAACYKSLLGRPIREVMSDLLESFRLTPDLKRAAKNDSDFDAEIRNTAEFQAAVNGTESD